MVQESRGFCSGSNTNLQQTTGSSGEGVSGTEPCLGLGEGTVVGPAAPPCAAGAVSPRFTVTSCFSKAVCLFGYLFFLPTKVEKGE